ncbi:MAG: acyl carrier protein [Magnetococcales bacterium]|nr:acyl carrier protein [Magnetococcales bacterium]
MTDLLSEIKTLLVVALKIEDLTPEDIGEDDLLFDAAGLGLDSIDALELGAALRKKYGVVFDAKTTEIRHHFTSVRTLATFILSQRTPFT